MSAWIKMMPVEGARGFLKEMFDKVMTPSGTVDNVMRVHSLRPQSMNGHYTLYKSVLHHADLSLPLWFLEAIAVYTSILNSCDYSLMHHYSNFEKLHGDVEWCRALRKALEEESPEAVLQGKDLALMRYAGKLTKTPGEMVAEDVLSAKREGASDEEILEVNQVCAYFNYSNRTLNGLGVSTEGDTIGYYQK